MASWWRAYSIAFSILYRIEWVETYPGGRDPEGIHTSFSILYRIEWVETYTENAALWSRLGATRDAIVKLVRDLATRLDALEQEDWKGLMAHLHTMWHNLERRVDELEVIVSGNDRTFREIITDNAELAARIKRLEKIHAEIPFPKGEKHD